jgi:hypothetical protein
LKTIDILKGQLEREKKMVEDNLREVTKLSVREQELKLEL